MTAPLTSACHRCRQTRPCHRHRSVRDQKLRLLCTPCHDTASTAEEYGRPVDWTPPPVPDEAGLLDGAQ